MGTELIRFISLLIIAYLIATPAGLWIFYAITGKDIRTVENSSGTGGGTNVSRTIEQNGFSKKKAVALAFTASIADIIKAAIPCLLAIVFTPNFLTWTGFIALMAVIGNILPVFVPCGKRFVGGKGVATAGGTMIALLIITGKFFFFAPWMIWVTAIITIASILTFIIRGRKLMVLASTMLIAGLLILFGFLAVNKPILALFPVCILAMVLLILLAHHKNIRDSLANAKDCMSKKKAKEQISY